MTARRSAVPPPLEVRGSLWLAVDGQPLGGHGRMALLRAVQAEGSITRAARAFGMSYKAAWEAIDAMNRVAGAPLVERTTGGKGGGATRLTERGERLLARHAQVDAVHQRFVELLSRNTLDLDEDFSLLKVLNVKTSARNQWLGSVGAIRAGAVNDEVEVRLPGGQRLTVLITCASTRALGLRLTQTVIVLAKSGVVTLATGLGPAKVSADNRLEGRVVEVLPGAVQAQVQVHVAEGLDVVALVPLAAVDDLGLAPGAPVSVLLKASDLILATVD